MVVCSTLDTAVLQGAFFLGIIVGALALGMVGLAYHLHNELRADGEAQGKIMKLTDEELLALMKKIEPETKRLPPYIRKLADGILAAISAHCTDCPQHDRSK